jgi:hypothetical protein
MACPVQDRSRSKNRRDSGTGVDMREGTTSRVMAADRPYGKFYDFTASLRKILDSPSYTKLKGATLQKTVGFVQCFGVFTFATLCQ